LFAVSYINGDREYTPEELADGVDLDDFLSGLAPKPQSIDYSQDYLPLPLADFPVPVPPPPPLAPETPRLRKIVRIVLGKKVVSPETPVRSPLQVPKTPVPRKRYITDPNNRPTVLYTEPIVVPPKNAFRAGYVKENIRLRVELESIRREQEAKGDYQHAKHLAESRASFREGVAAGYLKGAKDQLDALSRQQVTLQKSKQQKPKKKVHHNQRGYEQRLAKKARREEAKP
jgi:hypothetical protein